MSEEVPAPLAGADLGMLLDRVHQALAQRRDEIDALNVFPVPDGDTGTNLVLTARAAVEELAGAATDPDSQARAVVRGALTGARGNSGVIFSQVLRGFAETLADPVTEDPTERLALALARARRYAYEAVGEPVEGTILTAVRVAAETAADGGDDPVGVGTRVLGAVSDAVQSTREQLDANREAGVVDAGARGFEVFAESLLAHLRAEPLAGDEIPPPVVDRGHGRVADRESGSSEYRFEVQYLLHADPDRAPPLRSSLEELGDSVVVVAAEGLVNVHVHTNDIGAAVEAGAAHGAPSRIQVTEFADQLASDGSTEPASASDAGRLLGVVCVLPGPGLRELAESMAAEVVTGAAGSLPSVADLLAAVERAGGQQVVVLPGHPNVVPTAQQARDVSARQDGRTLHVLEVADAPPRVLAALSIFSPDGPVDAVLGGMAEVATACRAGEVVPAVRDADTPIGPIRAGQELATVDGEVVAVHDDPIAALEDVARGSGVHRAEVVTLVVGAEVDAEEHDEAVKCVSALLDTGAELEVVEGGQRPARYLLGVE